MVEAGAYGPTQARADLEQAGVNVQDRAWTLIEAYVEAVREARDYGKLTAITAAAEVWGKHVYDSLVVLGKVPEVARAQQLLDVGSGAGFPGALISMACGRTSVTLCDALGKRVRFLQETGTKLGLGYAAVHGRAEELAVVGSPFREGFGVAVARAVASLEVVAEWTLPFVQVGGCAVAYKGPAVDEELAHARAVLQLLGASLEDVIPYELPLGMGQRTFVVMRKTAPTAAQVPRRPGEARRTGLARTSAGGRGI
jgi:16S rRNA (guanine527-N7)-methyltransferase